MLGETFVIPEAKTQEETMYVPGTDGQKMSKSRGNFINIFQPDKQLRKQIMSVETDSTPLEAPKNPETCNVFALYKTMANAEELEQMKQNYLGGNYGYGHAKQALFELILERFMAAREKFSYLMENKGEIDAALEKGAAKADIIANQTLQRVREKLGYTY